MEEVPSAPWAELLTVQAPTQADARRPAAWEVEARCDAACVHAHLTA